MRPLTHICLFLLAVLLLPAQGCMNEAVQNNGGIFISSPPILVYPGERFEYEILLKEDPAIDAIVGHWPDWMCMKEGEKTLKGRPQAEHEGNHPVRLRVQSNGRVYEQAWIITVAARPMMDYPMPWDELDYDMGYLQFPVSAPIKEWSGTLFSEKPNLDQDIILANRPGVVVEVQMDLDSDGGIQCCYVIIDHDDSTRTMYTAIDPEEVFVAPGDQVQTGSPIARTLDPAAFAPVSWFTNSIESVLP